MAIGQHDSGNCTIEGTKPASCYNTNINQYIPLYKELTAIGYKLQVVKRVSREMYLKRVEALNCYYLTAVT